MRTKTFVLLAAMAVSTTVAAQRLPTTCSGFPANMRDGGPGVAARIGQDFVVHWAGSNWICQPPPVRPQVLLIGHHSLNTFDFRGPCSPWVCTVVDVAPVIILTPNSTSQGSGWVFRIPADPALRGAFFDMQVIAVSCVTPLPNFDCIGTGPPYRVVIG